MSLFADGALVAVSPIQIGTYHHLGGWIISEFRHNELGEILVGIVAIPVSFYLYTYFWKRTDSKTTRWLGTLLVPGVLALLIYALYFPEESARNAVSLAFSGSLIGVYCACLRFMYHDGASGPFG